MAGVAENVAAPRRAVTIIGVHAYSAAYPNAKFIIDMLRQADDVTLDEVCASMFPPRPALDRPRGILHAARAAFRTLTSHASVFVRYLVGRKPGIAYVPYPAIGILFLLSLLPRSLRPGRIVADAFISIYDTAVTDRGLIRPQSLRARLLKSIERRAYRATTLTTVDTDENRDYYAGLFDLPVATFAAAPLATDEDHFRSTPYSTDKSGCNVVFIGTFVPLQGTDVIARSILELSDRSDIRFTIVGSGQCAPEFARIIDGAAPERVNWIQDWQDSAAVAGHIRSADLCLGVFSPGHKAERVWPFKNYAYMASGRALITGATDCARRMLSQSGDAAFATVPTDDPIALSGKIRELADAPDVRARLARNARAYYDAHLSNRVIREHVIPEIIIGQRAQQTAEADA